MALYVVKNSRKFEIRISKDENEEKLILHFGLRISIPIKNCKIVLDVQKRLKSLHASTQHFTCTVPVPRLDPLLYLLAGSQKITPF
jgi:hypothetical protein